MLRKRSRAVSSKPTGLMAEPLTPPPPTATHSRPFPSPRLLVGLTSKALSEPDAAMSPTSILETKPFSAIANPFFNDRIPARKPLPWGNGDSSPVGLGIVDALKDGNPGEKSPKPQSRMVLFGSQLKVQIPASGGHEEAPQSPVEFGIKNKSSQLALLSPARKSTMSWAQLGGSEEGLGSSPRVFTGCLSATEMELSEDYTCVIAHGPNPRTTHIFDNCIVESCGSLKESSRFSGCRSGDFLTSCHACKKKLGQGKDIFMYRGEKAFCSRECRYQEMLFDGQAMEECPLDL